MVKKHTKQAIRCLEQIRQRIAKDTLTNTAYLAISDPKTGHIQCMIEACKSNTPLGGHANLGLFDNNLQVIKDLCEFYSTHPVIDTEATAVIELIASYWETELYAALGMVFYEYPSVYQLNSREFIK